MSAQTIIIKASVAAGSRVMTRMFEDANGFDGGDEYLIESNSAV